MPGVSEQTLLGTDSECAADGEFIVPSESKRALHLKRFLVCGLVASCLLGLTFTSHKVFAQNVAKAALNEKNKKISFNSSKGSGKYYWPSARGSIGSYLKSDYPGPLDISTPSWTWEYSCCFFCKWCTIPTGTAIDDQKNIFLTAADGIRKFSSSGNLLWRSRRVGSEEISKNAVLMDGAAYTISQTARAFAVSMGTGKELWSAVVAPNNSDSTNGAINAHDGVVIVAGNVAMQNVTMPGGGGTVIALNATNGKKLWEFTPDDEVWNFSPSFAGDGTFVYQDKSGKAYRQVAKNGTLVWKNGGIPDTWGDGHSNIGANGIVYATAGYGDPNHAPYPGALFAFSLTDGKLLWKRNVSVAPNSVPAVGILVGQTRPSVVIPTGYSSMKGPLDVHAFDAETGEDHWFFKGTYWKGFGGLSDFNPGVMAQRTRNSVRPITLPNAWAMPTVDSEGVVFVGDQAGDFWRLEDSDGDGKVSGPKEAKVCKTDAAWVGSADAAIAPGMLTTTNVKSLLVWNY